MVIEHGRPMVEDARAKFEENLIDEEVYNRVRANYEEDLKNQQGA
jgi:hypothetical protein